MLRYTDKTKTDVYLLNEQFVVKLRSKGDGGGSVMKLSDGEVLSTYNYDNLPKVDCKVTVITTRTFMVEQ